MSGYQRPVDAPISCSWACHLDRDPPSSEAGTDYACAYGTPVRAVAGGTVTYVKHSTSGAMGRVAEYRLDDGRDTRSIHLSEVWVGVGQRVDRGQHIGLSGASGFDSDWGYAAHLHHTLWPGPSWSAPTIDFEQYVGEEEDMTPEQAAMLENIANDTEWLKSRIGGSVANDDPTLTHVTSHATDWLEQRIGGSTSSRDLSYEIDDIHAAISTSTRSRDVRFAILLAFIAAAWPIALVAALLVR